MNYKISIVLVASTLLIGQACKDKKKGVNNNGSADGVSNTTDTSKKVVESPFDRPKFDPQNPKAPPTINAGNIGFEFLGKQESMQIRQFPLMHPNDVPDPKKEYSHVIEGTFFLDPPPSNGEKPKGAPTTMKIVFLVNPGKTGPIRPIMIEYNKNGVRYIPALGALSMQATRFDKQGIDYIADFNGTVKLFDTSIKPKKGGRPEPIEMKNFQMKGVVIKNDNRPPQERQQQNKSQTNQPGVIQQRRP